MKQSLLFSTAMVVFLFMWAQIATAQQAVRAIFSASTHTPTISVPFTLTLTVEAPQNATIIFPDFPTDWGAFTIIEVGELTKTIENDRAIYEQSLIVIAWTAGDIFTPDTFVEFAIEETGEAGMTAVQTAFFTISSTLDPEDTAIRPLKPAVSLFYISPLAILLITSGTIASGYYLRKRWQMRQLAISTHASSSSMMTPAQHVLARLRQLDPNRMSPFNLYPLVADELRHYLQSRLGIDAPEMTTTELMENLETEERLSSLRQAELERLLQQSDLVKFARIQPRPQTSQKLINAATQWVKNTEEELLHSEMQEDENITS